MSTVAADSAVTAAQETTRASVGFPGKYLSVTSFRPDGTAIATPVWFVQHDGLLYVETDGSSYKVRRIEGNPSVLVAPCTASGRPKAEPVGGHAEVLPQMPDAARAAYERKYRVDRVLVLPIYRLAQALRHKKAETGSPVALVITPGR